MPPVGILDNEGSVGEKFRKGGKVLRQEPERTRLGYVKNYII